jgi:hypothetical protein
MDVLQSKGMMINTKAYQDPLLYRLWVFLYNIIVASEKKGMLGATVYLNDVLYDLYMANDGHLENTAMTIFEDLGIDMKA